MITTTIIITSMAQRIRSHFGSRMLKQAQAILAQSCCSSMASQSLINDWANVSDDDVAPPTPPSPPAAPPAVPALVDAWADISSDDAEPAEPAVQAQPETVYDRRRRQRCEYSRALADAVQLATQPFEDSAPPPPLAIEDHPMAPEVADAVAPPTPLAIEAAEVVAPPTPLAIEADHAVALVPIAPRPVLATPPLAVLQLGQAAIRAQDIIANLAVSLRSVSDVIPTDPHAVTVIDSITRKRGVLLAHKTKTSHSDSVGVERHTLTSKSELFASTRWLAFIYGMRNSVERIKGEAAEKGHDLETWWMFLRCDETPLTMTIVDDQCLHALPEEVRHLVEDAVKDERGRDVGIEKLLQIEVTIVVEVRVGNDWTMFSWRVPIPILALGRTTAECYFQAITMVQAAIAMFQMEIGFPRSFVHTCVDREGGLGKALRALRHARAAASSPEKSNIDFITNCDVHVKAGNREEAYEPLDALTTKIKQAALSLSFGNMGKMFRAALRRVLLKLEQRPQSEIPAGARAVNLKALTYILPEDDEPTKERRTMLLNHFPGAWGKGLLVWYVLDGESQQATWVRMLTGATDCVYGTGIGSFPGRSWTKAEEAPRWITLLDLLGLWEDAYPEFCDLVSKGVTPEALLDAPAVAIVDGDPHPHVEEGIGGPIMDRPPGDGDEGDGAVPEEGPPEHAGDAGGDGAEPADPVAGVRSAAKMDQEEQHKQQHRWRQSTKQWARSGTTRSDLFPYTTLMWPHVKAMASSLWKAGDQYDKAERGKVAPKHAPDLGDQQLNEGPDNPEGEEAGGQATRSFRLIDQYDASTERKFHRRMAHLSHTESVWDPIPYVWRTLSNRNRAFIVSARSGALNHKNIQVLTNYPQKAVATIKYPWLAKEVNADCACPRRVDAGTRAWFDSNDGNVDNIHAQMQLMPMAIFGRGETVQIEWRHQRVRRFVVARSTQCRAVDLVRLNTWWLTDAIEAEQLTWWGAENDEHTANQPQQGDAEPVAQEGAGTRKRKHNPWNLFSQEAPWRK